MTSPLTAMLSQNCQMYLLEMLNQRKKKGIKAKYYATSQFRMGISCDFLTIYDDQYKTYLWGICITLNLFVALSSASESIYDVINMAAI